MPTYLTDEGICLRVTDFSETSQIVGVFTRGHGLLPLIAKGSKRQSKKNTMSGPLDLLTSGEVVFILPKHVAGGGELGTLAGWELVDHRNRLRGDLAALNAGMVAAEITTHLVQPHDPHGELFEELKATLELLPTPQRMRAIVAYAKAALTAAGYGPQLDACLACGKPIADVPLRFSARAGGIFCGVAAHGGSCAVQGPTIAVAGRIAAALHRLPTPRGIAAALPERPADGAALLAAMELLLAQVEAVTDKGIRTRYLLPSVFGVRAVLERPG